MRKGTCVTKGREDIISKRYKEISDIIKKNAADKVEQVVKKIAGISRSAWYKCISKGPRKGLVSASTVSKFAAFSGLSEDIFSGKIDFTPENKKALADKIKEVFSKATEEKAAKKDKKEKLPKIAKVSKKEKKAKKEKLPKIAKASKKDKREKLPKIAKVSKKDKRESIVKAIEKTEEKAVKKIKETKISKKDTGSTVNNLKHFATEIEGLNDLKQLENICEILEKLSKITEKKIDFVAALKEL